MAKLLGLPYPGGPHLARLAEGGNREAYALPKTLAAQWRLDFSFAGLKTAVLTQVKRLLNQALAGQLKADAALALPEAVRADVAA